MISFDEWWKADKYKFPQADYAAADCEEVARAAWEFAVEQERARCDEICESYARDAEQ